MTEGPFTAETKPWHTDECLDNLNAEFAACMSMISPDDRECLHDWIMWKVELGDCRDNPQAMARCLEYGDRYIAAKQKGRALERLHKTTDQYSTPLAGESHWPAHPTRRTVAGPPVTPKDPKVAPRDPPASVGSPRLRPPA